MRTKVTIIRSGWMFEWYGGRLADVYWAGKPEVAVECVEVGDYDWQTDKNLAPFTEATLIEAADRWVKEDAESYLVNAVPYL